MADNTKLIVTKSKLDALASSISEKSGVATPMTIAQMKTAVDGIAGGTITQDENGYLVLSDNGKNGRLEQILDDVIAGEITSYENNTIITLVDSMFRAGFWKNITSFKAHSVIRIENWALSSIGAVALAFPNLITTAIILNGNKKTQIIDFGPSYKKLTASTTQNANALHTIILRSPTLVECANTNNAIGNSFASDGTGGTLYVPSALISTYQSATNWSTILSYTNNSIQAIEGSIYETQYADGTPISS